MHIVAELQIVMFEDATPYSDGPAMNTRAALRSAAFTAPSTYPASTSNDRDPTRHESSSMATTATPATIDESTSPVLLCERDRPTQPPERYSPKLFFTGFVLVMTIVLSVHEMRNQEVD